MSQSGATLLVAAAGLFAVSLFTLTHRRDALGATLAAVIGFDAVACALVGFAGLAGTPAQAAQLQSFAVLVQVIGALWAAAGVSMAALLRRRAGGSDLLELVPVARRRSHQGTQPGDDEAGAEPNPDQLEAPPEGAAADPDHDLSQEP